MSPDIDPSRRFSEFHTELMFCFMPDGKLTFLNEASKRYFNLDDLTSHSIYLFSILSTIAGENIQKNIGSLTPDKPESRIIVKAEKGDGGITWQRWTNRAFFDDQGQVKEYMAIARDVTEQVKAEKALEIERDNLKNILNSMQDGVYVVNSQYDIQFINDALLKDFGPINGRKCYEYFHDKNEVCPWCKNPDVYKGNSVRWEWQSDKTQKTYDLIDTPLKNADGSIFKLEIFRDITLLKEAEEILSKSNVELEKIVANRTKELSETNVLIQSVLDGISEPLLMVDDKMVVKMLNDAAMGYYNVVGVEDFAGRTCFEAFRGIDIPCSECRIAQAIGVSEKMVFERESFEDPEKIEQVTIYPIKIEGNKTYGAIIRLTDITEIKAKDRRLVQSEKLAALGLLISGIAHEINNPNNFIILNIPTLKDYINDMLPIIETFMNEHPDYKIQGMLFDEFKSEIFSLIDDVEYGSQRIDACVYRLRDYVRLKNESHQKWINPEEIIHEAVSICHGQIKKETTHFNVEISGPLPKLYTDRDALIQVIVNLLVNACQALNKTESTITLSACETADPIRYLIISVSDNGSGMDEDTVDKVFDPFFTTKQSQSGTGLGLYISYNMVERLGGHIVVESKVNVGSTFKVALPIQSSDASTGS